MENKMTILNRTNLAKILLYIFDVLAVNFAYYITLVTRFYVAHKIPETGIQFFDAYWRFTPYYTAISIVVFTLFKLYNSVWRYAGINDLHRIINANIVTAILNIVCSCVFVKRMPISYYVIGAMIQFVLICISRFGYRVYLMEADRITKRKIDISMNVMIVGIGETAQIVRRRIDNDSSNAARLVCVFTTKIDRENTFFNGVPLVTGLDNFEKYIDDFNVNWVALADTSMPANVIKTIRLICEEKSVEVQDFSGFFCDDRDTRTIMEILNIINGSVAISINGEIEVYASGEEALEKLTGGYFIDDLSVSNGRAVLTLSDSKKIISSPKEDEWVKTLDNVDKVSFF